VARHDDEQLRDRAVRAPELLAVDDVRSPSSVSSAVVASCAGSEPTPSSVRANAEIAPGRASRQESALLSGVPKILTGCGTPIDWCAESSAERLPS
jgi:hypothetical protein